MLSENKNPANPMQQETAHPKLAFEAVDGGEFLYKSDETRNTACVNAGNEDLWLGGGGLNGFFQAFLSKQQGLKGEDMS